MTNKPQCEIVFKPGAREHMQRGVWPLPAAFAIAEAIVRRQHEQSRQKAEATR